MLLLKLTLAPLLIAAVSFAGQRFGHLVAGLLAGFPIIAGPIFVVLTLEQGTDFGYRAAASTLAGLSAFATYALSYAWLSRKLSWPLTLLASWGAFALASLLLSKFEGPLAADIGLAVVSLAIAYRLMPKPRAAMTKVDLPHGEVLLRMLAGALLVLAVTGVAHSAGPHVAGLLTPFPIAGSVLAACSHRAGGSDAVAHMLRGMIGGLASLIAFFTAVASLLTDSGLGVATAIGLAAAIAIQLVLLRLHARTEPAE